MDSQFSLAILLREAGGVNYVDVFGNCMMKAELDLCTDDFQTGSSEMAPKRGISQAWNLRGHKPGSVVFIFLGTSCWPRLHV